VTAVSALSNTSQRSVYNSPRRPILRPVQLLLVYISFTHFHNDQLLTVPIVSTVKHVLEISNNDCHIRWVLVNIIIILVALYHLNHSINISYLNTHTSIHHTLHRNRLSTYQHGLSSFAAEPILGTEGRYVTDRVRVQIILEQLRLKHNNASSQPVPSLTYFTPHISTDIQPVGSTPKKWEVSLKYDSQ